MLLANWHPVTHDFGLIQAPLERVVSALCDWHGSIGKQYHPSKITIDLQAALTALLPLSNAKQRKLFVRTESDWTAYYQNGIQGSDPFPVMSELAQALGVLAMRVCQSPPGALHPATIWEVYAPPSLGGSPPLGYRRSIAAVNDGGRWVFEESGAPFDFEDLEAYTARSKRERFPVQHLTRYLGHFGIRPFDDDFLRVDAAHPALLLQDKEPLARRLRERLHPTLPEFTLQEVIDGVPWKRST